MQERRFYDIREQRASRRQLLTLGARATLGLGLAGLLEGCAIPGFGMMSSTTVSTPTPVSVPVNVLSGHTSPITWVGWQPKNLVVASAGRDDGLRLWDTTKGTVLVSAALFDLFTPNPGQSASISAAAWSPDGKTIALGFSDSNSGGGIRLWDVATKSVRVSINTSEAVMHLGWSPDNKQLVSGGYSSLSIWSASDGSLVKQAFQLEGHGGAPAWSPDGKTIAVATYSGSVALVNPSTMQASATYSGVGNGATGVVWSPKGTYLTGVSNVLVLFQPPQKQASFTIDVGFAANAAAWSPDEHFLAGARYGVNVADVSRQSVVDMLGSNADAEQFALAWASDGARLASGGADGIIHIYAANNL